MLTENRKGVRVSEWVTKPSFAKRKVRAAIRERYESKPAMKRGVVLSRVQLESFLSPDLASHWLLFSSGERVADLKDIRQALQDARWILDLPNDWDDEGAPCYSIEHWGRVEKMLLEWAQKAWKEYGYRLPIPAIGPAPEGGIDLHWKREQYELLVTLPADSGKPGVFYGDDYADNKLKGTFVQSSEIPDFLICLLKRNL